MKQVFNALTAALHGMALALSMDTGNITATAWIVASFVWFLNSTITTTKQHHE